MARDKTDDSHKRAKVLIVDDHPAIREALAIRIAHTPDLAVCGEAEDLTEAMRLVADKKPDVAIVDISLKSGDGIDLIKHIKARRQNVRMLVWSMHGEKVYAERALRAGALGYITKEQATDQIIDAIRQVLADKLYLSPSMMESMVHRTLGAAGEVPGDPVEVLSDRELEVFRRIGLGQKARAIAGDLHLSVKTVETYRDRIREKLGLADGTELARAAFQWVMQEE